MATVLPPPSKRQKLAAQVEKQQKEEDAKIPEGLGSVRVQFIDQATGQITGAPVSLPVSQAYPRNLELLLNSLQGQGESNDNPRIPYRFSFLPAPTDTVSPSSSSALDITTTLYHALLRPGLKTTEDLISLHYTPLSIFRVRAVTRCSASIPGHGEPILAVSFSPISSARMVSGSGDCTARIWDCETNTPFATLKGHTGWVLAVTYSPWLKSQDGSTIATGSYDKTVRLWDAKNGQQLNGGKPLKGHAGYITSLCWEPFHLSTQGRPRLASASKDGTVRVWDTVRGVTDMHLARHTSTVSCVRWSGGESGDVESEEETGIIYTASHDKTVKVWDARTGALLRSLDAHVHWVNHLALSSDFALRTAFYDHMMAAAKGKNAAATLETEVDDVKRSIARNRYHAAATRGGGGGGERMVTASDDNTLYLWSTSSLLTSSSTASKPKPLARLLGHSKPINHTLFSPSGSLIASCSFDGLIKLWSARDGTFLRNLKGHVAAVYMVSFSADSRLLVSCGKDMTLKVWDVETGSLKEDLPGHKGEVYAVDWAPDGVRVGSGSQDRTVRIWTN